MATRRMRVRKIATKTFSIASFLFDCSRGNDFALVDQHCGEEKASESDYKSELLSNMFSQLKYFVRLEELLGTS